MHTHYLHGKQNSANWRHMKKIRLVMNLIYACKVQTKFACQAYCTPITELMYYDEGYTLNERTAKLTQMKTVGLVTNLKYVDNELPRTLYNQMNKYLKPLANSTAIPYKRQTARH